MKFGVCGREEEKARQVRLDELGEFRRKRGHGRTMRLETTRECMMSALQSRELGTKGGEIWDGNGGV